MTSLLAVLLASGAAAGMIEDLANLRFDKLGNPFVKTDAIAPVEAPRHRPHKLLILPVRFPDVGYVRFKGEKDADEKNRKYFQDLLFSDVNAPKPGTMTHYYWHQSKGRYHITGTVFPVQNMPQELHKYGRSIRNSDGEWRNDAAPELLVEHALQAAVRSKPDFPWADYDIWDPMDYDGDGVRDEPDGYIDHFVMVYAGKGQSSCQSLFSLNEKLTANAPADVIEKMSPEERECVDRIWPHRFSLSKNTGLGPVVEGRMNARGGLPLKPGLWVYDYNMQAEYTELATFIHEFGHSLGLPDIYARETSNSTGVWEAMSHTAGPWPQELSAWSRMVLGWLKPCVITPPSAGGAKVQSVYLKNMSDWAPGRKEPAGLCDAALVALPPKTRELKLGPLGPAQGRQAAYSAQGNDLRHGLSREFDFSAAPSTAPLALELDAWFKIEADWDYLYVQASTDGLHWTRLMPTDKSAIDDAQSVMPSKKGHDGAGTVPGFTGRSGDLDGDGKVETAAGCDPKKEKAHHEDRVGGQADPCESAQWVRASFDLDAWRGKKARLRFFYFTDGAAVEEGALVDNVEIKALGFKDDFEGPALKGWSSEGWTVASGAHVLQVPHYYVLEHRDPYAKYASAHNYDRSLDEPGLSFYPHPEAPGGFYAIDARPRPGVVAWYANGSFLWSENDPSRGGPGKGFLLVVDSNPQEIKIPGFEGWWKEDGGWSRYETGEPDQAKLRESFLSVMCFERRPAYVPPSIPEADRKFCAISEAPPVESLRMRGKPLMYGMTIVNEFLPGPEQDRRQGAGSLYDLRIRGGKTSYRLYDRRLRGMHTEDAPFALDPFPDQLRLFKISGKEVVPAQGWPAPAVSRFSDSQRWLNPKLPFTGVDVPEEGLSWELARPKKDAPAGTKVKVYFAWDR